MRVILIALLAAISYAQTAQTTYEQCTKSNPTRILDRAECQLAANYFGLELITLSGLAMTQNSPGCVVAVGTNNFLFNPNLESQWFHDWQVPICPYEFGPYEFGVSNRGPTPIHNPSYGPTINPTFEPTSANPTTEPSVSPTFQPTIDSSTNPTLEPTMFPTQEPTAQPTNEPSKASSANMNTHTITFCGEAVVQGRYVNVYNMQNTDRANYDSWDNFCASNSGGFAFGGNGNDGNNCNWVMSQLDGADLPHGSDDFVPHNPNHNNIYMLCTINLQQISQAETYRHCRVPDHFDSDCDHIIIAGTKCNIYFRCPEDKHPIAVEQTCQEDSTWAGEPLDPNCERDYCPYQAGYLTYETGGCRGYNELGTFFTTLEQCAQRCDSEDSCVSFEFSKPFPNHPEPNRCALSSTCTYDDSAMDSSNQNCLYIEDSANPRNGEFPPGLSDDDGRTTHHRVCPIPEHYGTTCEGVILSGTTCGIFFLCPERRFSRTVTMTCQNDSTWAGENPLDPNCFESEEPTLNPSRGPTPQITTYEDICAQVCPGSPTCGLCYTDEVAPQFCHTGSSRCTVNIEETTIQFMEESMCASYSMTAERCYETGGNWLPSQSICVTQKSEQETCVTKGGEQQASLSSATVFHPGQKACRLKYGYICDKDVGFLASERVFVVPEDHACPSFEGWPMSCDFLANSNEIAEPESESATTALTITLTVIMVALQCLFL